MDPNSNTLVVPGACAGVQRLRVGQLGFVAGPEALQPTVLVELVVRIAHVVGVAGTRVAVATHLHPVAGFYLSGPWPSGQPVSVTSLQCETDGPVTTNTHSDGRRRCARYVRPSLQ